MSVRLLNALEEVKTLPDITLGSIVHLIEKESVVILCLVGILPFLQPIPVPGLSSVLGLIVILQGIGLLIWSRPLLTQKLLNLHITHERFEHILKAAKKVSYYSEKLSSFKHPIVNHRLSHVMCGISIILSAAFLSLPLPIPFSNSIPAFGIFFICIGLLEEDLALILCGHLISVAVYFMAYISYHVIIDQIQYWT